MLANEVVSTVTHPAIDGRTNLVRGFDRRDQAKLYLLPARQIKFLNYRVLVNPPTKEFIMMV
jgi:hypothetical protein